MENSFPGLWVFLWGTNSRKHLLYFSPDFSPLGFWLPLTPFLQCTNGQADLHMSLFFLQEEVCTHLWVSDILWWLPHAQLYPPILPINIYYCFLNMTLFLLGVIIFFSQNKWGTRSLAIKADRQVFILFIMIPNFVFCHFPPCSNKEEANGIPVWKGIKNRCKYVPGWRQQPSNILPARGTMPLKAS